MTRSPGPIRQVRVLAAGEARERRPRLPLRARGDDAELAGRQVARLGEADGLPRRQLEHPELAGDGAVHVHGAARGARRAAPPRGRRRRSAGSGGCWRRSRRRRPARRSSRRPPRARGGRRTRSGAAGLLRVGRVGEEEPHPAPPQVASSRARSVGGPATGRASSLKSPEWMIIPCGVSMAMAQASGMEWVTAIHSATNGEPSPASRTSPGTTLRRSASIPASSSRRRTIARVKRVP